jgi:hypothetical protein
MELADTKRAGGPTIDEAFSRFVDKVPFWGDVKPKLELEWRIQERPTVACRRRSWQRCTRGGSTARTTRFRAWT